MKKTQARNKNMWVILDHKAMVATFVQKIVTELFARAVLHDYSKFGPEEFDSYSEALPRFEQSEYGTEEYKAVCESIKPAIQHHVTTNRHHPEYFPNGVNDMNLIDLIEMVCDWVAASKRGGGGPLRLDLQRDRFGIDPQLMRIIENTVTILENKSEENN